MRTTLAVLKLADPVPDQSSVAFAVAAGEALLGILMLVPKFSRTSLNLFVLLAMAFVAFQITNVLSGRGRQSCGCAGASTQMTHGIALLVASGLLATGLLVRRWIDTVEAE